MKRLKYSAAIVDAIEEVRRMPVEEGARAWTVCLKLPSGEVVGHLRLPSYEQVSALGRRLRLLGYEMSMLHGQETACDFVFAERGPTVCDE